MKLVDNNGDDVADTMEVLGQAGSIQEHGPHAIRRRPDGGMAVIVGNNETIADNALDLTSPVLRDKDAQFLPYFANFGQSAREGAHSAIFDWNPSDKKFRVFAGGNRNAYDFAYNLAGEAFLFDSDMEWDIGLPWYRDVRTAHEVLNGNYGYRNGSGKYPAYYLDSLPPVRDLGRGSPVGVEFYTSYAYPKEFFDNLFEADWSRGRLLYTALTPAGATYTARTDRAEFVHGEPFNITDVEVGPDGLMYFTTGGRGTSGGLWRLRYKGALPAAPDMTGVLGIVRQPQPLSSFGWAAIERAKASMGAGFAAELEKLARSASAAPADRARAIYEMQRHGAAPAPALLQALASDKSAEVRAAVVYVAGVQGAAARAVAAGRPEGRRPRRPPARRRGARASRPDARQAVARAGQRHLRALERSRPVRALGRADRDRAHRAGGLEGSGRQGDESSRGARRHARLRAHRQWRRPAAGARTAARHAAPDQPLDRRQAPPLSRPDVHHDGNQGRHDPGPAGTAARVDRRSVSGEGRAPQSRACADAGIRRPAGRRSASCSRRCRRAMRTRSCSCSISTGCE